MMDHDGEISSCYTFLLQPIRDLQKNWDVDISHLLDEFLEKVQQYSNSEGGEDRENVPRPKFNFAEAAILIQGTSMVYSKKVDYVHGLAHEFYEQLKDKKKARKGGAENRDDDGGGDGEVDANQALEELEDPCELLDLTNLPTVPWQKLMLKRQPKCPPLLSQIPISMIPLADFEKRNVLLYSSRNPKEVIGKKDDFFINTGIYHKSGALLLEEKNAKLVDEFTEEEEFSDDSESSDISGSQSDNDQPQKGDTEQVENVRRRTSTTNLLTAPGHETNLDELISDNRLTAGMEGMQEGNKISEGDENFDEMDNDGQMSFAGFDEDEEANDHHPADEEVFYDEEQPVMDIFRSQPYKHGPYKACVPGFVPHRMVKLRSEKRKKFGMSALSYYLHEHVYHNLPKGIKNTEDDDFELIFGKEMRQLERRRMSVLKGMMSKGSEEGMKQPEADVQSDDEMEHNDYYGLDEDGDSNGGADIPPPAQEDHNLSFGNIDDDDLGGHMNISSLLLDFDDSQVAQKPADQLTYVEMLVMHLRKYWSTGEEITSELVKRVEQWEEKMEPRLEEEEKRREFDIHQYGSELLEQFKSIGETKNFAELVSNVTERYDISRYFLAPLMLANTGNVKLDCDSQGITDSKMDGTNIWLKLLKHERHHQQFSDNAQMPSGK